MVAAGFQIKRAKQFRKCYDSMEVVKCGWQWERRGYNLCITYQAHSEWKGPPSCQERRPDHAYQPYGCIAETSIRVLLELRPPTDSGRKATPRSGKRWKSSGDKRWREHHRNDESASSTYKTEQPPPQECQAIARRVRQKYLMAVLKAIRWGQSITVKQSDAKVGDQDGRKGLCLRPSTTMTLKAAFYTLVSDCIRKNPFNTGYGPGGWHGRKIALTQGGGQPSCFLQPVIQLSGVLRRDHYSGLRFPNSVAWRLILILPTNESMCGSSAHRNSD